LKRIELFYKGLDSERQIYRYFVWSTGIGHSLGGGEPDPHESRLSQGRRVDGIRDRAMALRRPADRRIRMCPAARGPGPAVATALYSTVDF
jgi:hypothetical protein